MKWILITLVSSALLFSCSKNEPKSIAIQPLGSFDAALVDSIATSIEKTFQFDVTVLPMREIPKSAFINVKSPRYRGDTILHIFRREKPKEFDHILGLTASDISTTKRDANGNTLEPKSRYQDWGVFGLGQLSGPCCIVSSFRLKTNDPKQLMERLKKVCNHEIGHNLGLEHCTSSNKCVMTDAAESIRTVDTVHLVLCEDCASKVN